MFVEDIIESIEKIETYISKLDYDEFSSSSKTIDAVVRNLEIIGEASRNIPTAIRTKHSEIQWKRMIGLRNIVSHQYFGIDLKIIWQITTKNLPETKPLIKKLIEEINTN